MLTVICVLKSGGIYDASWVEKLKNGVSRNLKRPHKFVCLSDAEVPCERIPLIHDWPGWWSKIELFRPGVITGDTLYLDLDTVVTGDIGDFAGVECDFAMLRSFNNPDFVGSGVMWFGKVPHKVYEKFAKQPDAYIAHYERNRDGTYVGDQAFISDTLGADIERLDGYFDGIRSYKVHCRKRLPEDAKIVCFHGKPRPTEIDTPWMEQHWS
tara:strand:- start:1171 stop:1803 length:633 start_codon:yes stop_codon:yes gene_type:complete